MGGRAIGRGLAFVLLLGLGIETALAQEPAWPGFRPMRYDEDWRGWCRRPGAVEWPDRLKCIVLADGVTLTLGAELRERIEVARNPDFGFDAAHDHAFLLRAMTHADLRVRDSFRVFLQLGAFGEGGRKGPPSPTEVDRLDVTQGFADISFALDHARFTLRGGRQEIVFGSQRLIGVRDGANLRRSFDGGRSILTAGDFRLDGLWLRPVRPETGVFDDRRNKAEQLWGFYGTGPLIGPLRADLYYLGLQRDRAGFAQGIAEERRHTMGTRVFGARDGFDWDVEAVLQLGDFGGARIFAWTVASDFGVTFDSLPLRPRLGLKADIASGDRNLSDARLGTFNALYPRLPYFSEANLIAPANFMDLHPTVQLRLAPGLTAEIGWNALWRQTTADAVYTPPLSPMDGTAGQPGRFIGQQAIVGLAWTVNRYVTVAGQYVHFVPGRAVERAGGGTVDFVYAAVSWRY